MWVIITNVWKEDHPARGYGNSIQGSRPIGPFDTEEDGIRYLESHGWKRISEMTSIKAWRHETQLGMTVVRQLEKS